MGWMHSLYETYQADPGSMAPVAHTTQQAHLEVVLNGRGTFLRAMVLDRDQSTTLVPCTEGSGGRSGIKPTHHPLCDKLQYLAGDFLPSGGQVTAGFANAPEEPHMSYLADLRAWAGSIHGHPKLTAILAYLERGSLVHDLIAAGALPSDGLGRILAEWEGPKAAAPAIFRHPIKHPLEAFVRFRVETSGVPASGTWEDADLLQAWVEHYASLQDRKGICMVTGQETVLAEQHPAKLRNAADKAKLISANDGSGFTYRGRFTDADQACGIGYEVTQKAHIALRTLIKRRHAYRNGEQVILSWAVQGQPVPDPFSDSATLFGVDLKEPAAHPRDLGQGFARRLASCIAGYRATLGSTANVVILSLDAATPGRMSICYYRELTGSEFLDRIEAWHRALAWPQNLGKDRKFVGAPTPMEIAEAAYGGKGKDKSHDKLLFATVARILPCILEARPLPSDLVRSAFTRTCSRAGLKAWEFERNLGITCSLIRAHHPKEDYPMALDPERTSRDYLFGRLLALAEHLEGRALNVAGESRDSTAAKLMQRFAHRPASTWQTIHLALTPYRSRLRSKRPGTLAYLEARMDQVMAAFAAEDFIDDTRKLGPEFLLGYHCERQALWAPHPGSTAPEPEPATC